MPIAAPLIFIGTGRNGSTYISNAIFQHREIGYPSNYVNKFPSIPEINGISLLLNNRFWRYSPGTKSQSKYSKFFFIPSEAYNMWDYVLGSEIDFSRNFLLNTKASEELKFNADRYFDRMIESSRKKKLAFKITGPGRVGFLLSLFPNAKFVWVKRNLLETLRSILMVQFWKEKGYDKLWFNGAFSESEKEYALQVKRFPELVSAMQLRKIVDTTDEELKLYNPPCIQIQYENYLDNPLLEIERILTFANLPEDIACFNYLNFNPVKRKSYSDDWMPQEIKSEIIKLLYS